MLKVQILMYYGSMKREEQKSIDVVFEEMKIGRVEKTTADNYFHNQDILWVKER